MTVVSSNRAIFLREWAEYYADRWQIDAGALVSRAYDANLDRLPTPEFMRSRVQLLHEIAASLGRLFPL